VAEAVQGPLNHPLPKRARCFQLFPGDRSTYKASDQDRWPETNTDRHGSRKNQRRTERLEKMGSRKRAHRANHASFHPRPSALSVVAPFGSRRWDRAVRIAPLGPRRSDRDIGIAPFGPRRSDRAVRTAPFGPRHWDRAVRTAPFGPCRSDRAVRIAPFGPRHWVGAVRIFTSSEFETWENVACGG
jgi:hypothetical protein